MNEQKITGIVLNSIDYRDKDKLVEVFSAELGKITCILKSCRTASAKLKFAFQPLCLAEFIVTKKSAYYVIINAYCIDSFFEITKVYENYETAMSLLEITRATIRTEEPLPELLVLLINSLKLICYEGYNAKIILIKFLLSVLTFLGYMLNFNKCSLCKNLFNDKIYINYENGSFVCSNCKTLSSISITKEVFAILKIIDKTDTQKLNTLKFNALAIKDAIMLLSKNLEHRVFKQIKSLNYKGE